MTIEEHICSGGIATVPDLRGSKECYSSSTPFESLVITQIPEPGSLVDAGQTVINVLTEDGNGNATVCTHYLNVTADNPAPTLECPEAITAWLLAGGVEVPDYTKVVDIIGGCTVYDDLVITQSPEAGSFLTTAGVHTITISVTDKLGHTVVCGSTTITITDLNPSVTPVSPPAPPATIPDYIYPFNLLAYWPLDFSTNLPAPPLYQDFSPVITHVTPGRHLTPGAGVDTAADQTIVSPDCHSGLSFGSGSAYLSRSNLAYLTRADDAGLRLVGTSWTIRFGLRVIAADSGTTTNLIRKHLVGGANGYQILLTGNFGMYVNIFGSAVFPILDTGAVGLTLGAWTYYAVTLDDSTSTLKVYKDGALASSDTNAGAHMTASTELFTVGDPVNGASNELYVDEVGIWTEAWSPARVMDDFNLLNCN